MHLRHVEGQLVFPSGVYEQRIEIPILESPLWSATLEFKVVLESPMGCQLGRYLKICRVKVIDQDSFPSSYYAEQIAENVEDVRQTGLFIEYVKHILEQPGNTWRFMITLLFDQLKNLYVPWTSMDMCVCVCVCVCCVVYFSLQVELFELFV